MWFDDEEDEIYRLIGEIAGYYQKEDSGGIRTILDRLLDMSRRFDSFRLTENVIRAMCKVFLLETCEKYTEYSGCFKECDFRNAMFLIEEYRELLPDMGTIL